MIFGTGLDIIEIDRIKNSIKKYSPKFEQKDGFNFSSLSNFFPSSIMILTIWLTDYRQFSYFKKYG